MILSGWRTALAICLIAFFFCSDQVDRVQAQAGFSQSVVGLIQVVEAAQIPAGDSSQNVSAAKSDAQTVNEESPAASALQPEQQAQSRRESAEAVQKNRKELQAQAWAGMAALAGILFCGVMLVIFVLVGARRVKRLTRKPLPTQHQMPEYWFVNREPPLGTQAKTRSYATSNPAPAKHNVHHDPDSPTDAETPRTGGDDLPTPLA